MVSLYIHVPFCKKKCRYCDFVSYDNSFELADKYIDSLLKEAESYKKEEIATVFIGGGTPSLFTANQFERLACGILDVFDMSRCKEFTVEANPESITSEKLRIYKSLGVNRLSIGLQSAVDKELKMLGRIHTYDDFLRSYEMARKEFDNINIDLISGLPNQTVADFTLTLEQVVSLKPEHISVYSLIAEPNTPIANDIKDGLLKLPDEDTDRDIYKLTGKFLSLHGYNRYEISNYALNNKECKHNLTYWNGGDYIGLGCAAHSLYNGKRSQHTNDIRQYIVNPYPNIYDELSYQDKLEEYIMLRLRLINGFSISDFNTKFGYSILERKKDAINMLLAHDLIIINNDNLRLSERGLDVCDSVILSLI